MTSSPFRGFALTALALSCGSPTRHLSLPLPEESRSYVVAGPGPRLSLYARETPLAVEIDPAAPLFILAYSSGAEDLGVPYGPIEPEVSCRSCRLARPGEAFALSPPDFDPHEVGAAPEQVLDALVPDRSRCAACTQFEVQTLSLPPTDRPDRRTLTKVGRDSAFVTSVEGDAHWVSESGVLRPACTRSTEFRPMAAGRARGSHVAFGDALGRVLVLDTSQLDPALPCDIAILTTTPSLGSPVDALDALEGSSSEVVALTVSTTIARFRDDRWEVLGSFEDEGNELHVAAAQDGLYAVCGSPRVARIDRSGLHWLEAKLGGLVTRPTAVGALEGRGVVFGTQNHWLLELSSEEGAMTSLTEGTTILDQRVDAVTSYAESGGILSTLRRGGLLQFRALDGYCDRIQLPSNASYESVVTFGSGVAMVADVELLVLRPATAPECPGLWTSTR